MKALPALLVLALAFEALAVSRNTRVRRDTPAFEMLARSPFGLQGERGQAVTFTRASAGTCFDASTGVISALATDAPCLTSVGYLSEAQGVNTARQSAALSSASWSSFAEANGASPTVTADQATGPDATLTADRVEIAAAASPATSIRAAYGASVTSGAIYTVSAYVKGNATSGTTFIGEWNGGNGNKCTQTACAYNATTWTRCTHTFTADETSGATDRNAYVGSMSGRGCAASGLTATDIFVTAFQRETGSVATSYQPTTTSSATRAATLLVGPAAASLPVATGTIELDFIPLIPSHGPDEFLFSSLSGTGLRLYRGANSAWDELILQNEAGGVLESAELTWVPGTSYHIKVMWGGGVACIYRDNVKLVSGAFASPASHGAALAVGSLTTGASVATGRISGLVVRNAGQCP